jgi:hypothetical protein
VKDSERFLRTVLPGFGVFVDMRGLKPLSEEAQKVMVRGQALYKKAGMKRSVVVLASAVIAMQFRRLAKESGIYEWERYLDPSTHPDFESVGVAWLEKAADPDKKAA